MFRKPPITLYAAFLLSSIVLSLGMTPAIATPADTADSKTAEKESADVRDRRCLGINQIRRIEIIDDSTIYFHMRGGRGDYINHLPHRCPGLKSRGTFMHSTSTNNYCDLDTISVIDTNLGMRLASCPLGRFEAVEPQGAAQESEQ